MHNSLKRPSPTAAPQNSLHYSTDNCVAVLPLRMLPSHGWTASVCLSQKVIWDSPLRNVCNPLSTWVCSSIPFLISIYLLVFGFCEFEAYELPYVLISYSGTQYSARSTGSEHYKERHCLDPREYPQGRTSNSMIFSMVLYSHVYKYYGGRCYPTSCILVSMHASYDASSNKREDERVLFDAPFSKRRPKPARNSFIAIAEKGL